MFDTLKPVRKRLTHGVAACCLAISVAAFGVPGTAPLGESPATAQSSGANLLASGSFRGDRSHRASGTARIVGLSNGRRVLQLRDFRVTGGPDLRVWITDSRNFRTARAARRADHIDLGELQSSRGNQNYVIQPVR